MEVRDSQGWHWMGEDSQCDAQATMVGLKYFNNDGKLRVLEHRLQYRLVWK
jgi:hypothetical protein